MIIHWTHGNILEWHTDSILCSACGILVALSNVSELVKSECFKWLCVFVSVRREGIAVVCVSRISSGAP